MPKVSIIIPTFNLIDELKNCLNSIRRTTSGSYEVIVVSNGCHDGTVEYVSSLGNPFKIIHWPKALGYTKAANIGVSVSEGEYIVMFNNDTMVLDYGKDSWLSMLLKPFDNSKAGITGPSKLWRGGKPWIMFWCAMIKREVFNKVGLLDEIFSPGAGEDTDFCLKAQNCGFTVHQVPCEENSWTYTTTFPIFHKGGMTMNTLHSKDEIYNRNEKILTDRYGAGANNGYLH